MAWHYIDRLLASDYDEIRIDLPCFARIFHLLILLEHEDQEELSKAVRAASGFLATNERLFPIEESILKFIGDVSANMKPTKKSLSELKEKIADQAKVKYAGNFDEF